MTERQTACELGEEGRTEGKRVGVHYKGQTHVYCMRSKCHHFCVTVRNVGEKCWRIIIVEWWRIIRKC